MTVQYGEDTGSSGYGDMHPALQNHLNNMQNTLNKLPSNPQSTFGTTPYNADPQPKAAQGPAQGPVNQANDTPTTPYTQGGEVSNTGSPVTQATQMPNQTAMAGAAAGGSADNANAPAGKDASQGKPANMTLGTPNAPIAPVDTSDTDAMGQDANNNLNNVIAEKQYRDNMANQQYWQGQQGQQGNGNYVLGNNASVPGFDNEQVQNAKAIIQQGLARGMSQQDITTALMTGLTESSLRNLNYGDRDSLGLFQQRPSQGWGSPDQIMDPNYAANKFYDTLAGVGDRGSMTPWEAAQAVQRSAFADGSNYQAQYGAAQQLFQSLTQKQPQGFASSPTMQSNGSLSWISQNTDKYLDYDGYYGAQCVDLYDFYTTGFVGGQPIPVGYADEIWNNHDSSVYTQIDSGQVPHMGDVAVWGRGPSTPMSHVGIIIGDNGDGTVKTLSNNATSAGSSGNSAVVNISKAALLGYLRPNRLMGV